MTEHLISLMTFLPLLGVVFLLFFPGIMKGCSKASPWW